MVYLKNIILILIKIFSLFSFSFFVFCWGVIGFVYSSETINGVSAIVKDQIILKSDVDRELMTFSYQNQIDIFSDQELYQKHFNKTQAALVLRKVALLYAYEDTNIIISNNEIERSLASQIDLMINQVGSEEALEKELNKNIREIKAEYWDMIKDMLFFDRLKYLKTQNVYVTRQEVVEFFELNKSLFPDVEDRFDFSVFVVDKKAGVLTEKNLRFFLTSIRDSILTNMVSFEDMARKHSDDPGTALSGGLLGFTQRGTLVKDYEEVAYNLNVGELSMPFKSVFGYHLVLLVDRVGEKIKSKHILKTLSPTQQDVIKSSSWVDSLFVTYVDNLDGFDEYVSSKKNNLSPFSGLYLKDSFMILPEELWVVFNDYVTGVFFEKIETEASFFIVKITNKYPKEVANIINSWAKIEDVVLYNKKEKVFNNWLEKRKKNIFIQVY